MSTLEKHRTIAYREVSLDDGSEATDSELTDDDVIVRYEGDEVIGLTILHASTR